MSPHRPAGPALAVAIDGGNSKTEVVVLELRAGGLRERMRAIGAGSGGGPQAVVAAVDAVFASTGARPSARLSARAAGRAAVTPATDAHVDRGAHARAEAGPDGVAHSRAALDPERVLRVSAAVAGLDFPGDEAAYRSALAGLFPHAAIDVVGDAVAVLEAGGGAGDGLALVCGAGLNAVARGPRGRATVPALGWVSGDWGGGHELGREAVRAAARAEDGRGPRTALLGLVLGATGEPDTVSLARTVRDGRLGMREIGALATAVADAAAVGDAVAAGLMERAAREAVALAGVVARGAWGRDEAVPEGTPAVLAGGLFEDAGFRAAVSVGLRGMRFDSRPLAFRPVDGLVRALRDQFFSASTAAPAPPDSPPAPTPARKDPR